MESVLHIEPIARHTPSPLHIGHTDHLFYGESLTIDDENVGDVTSHLSLGAPICLRDDSPVHMGLGAPLMGMDSGSPVTHVPLVKTIEYMPDFTRKEGNIYLETTHYFKDRRTLIPFRSRLRSGLGGGLRINHLPSLNFARRDITGFDQVVCDPRSEIIDDIALRDDIFRRRQNRPLQDWLTYDLAPALDRRPVTTLSFDADDINKMIPSYINQVRDTPSEFNQSHLKEIAEKICPFIPDASLIPPAFTSGDPLAYDIRDVRRLLVNNTVDFRTMGTIPISRLNRIDYNPKGFQDVCDLMDCIPLTDFNIDLVLDCDKQIVFYQEHLAINRFCAFSDVDMGLYRSERVLEDYINGETLNEILERFVSHHSDLNAEIRDIIDYNQVKIKLMKTMSDEAAILLYRYDSAPNDPPICGVYFDIALQSLAPMSVIPLPRRH